MNTFIRSSFFWLILSGLVVTLDPSLAMGGSSRDAKEKVDDAEKAFESAQAAKDREKKADDEWFKKQSASFQDMVKANQKREEADAARKKANETGKQEDIKAAEKAEKIADNAEKKAAESDKALGEAARAREAAMSATAAAKNKVGPLIESAGKAVEELPESSVKEKLEERIRKVKGGLNQFAMAGNAPGTVETPWNLLGFFAKLDPRTVRVDITGTKETIGHVATLTVRNDSKESLQISIPPTVLESRTKKVQNYALTEPHELTVGPGEYRSLPLTGVCLDARVPPAGPENQDELRILDPDSAEFDRWSPLLSGTQAAAATAKTLQEEGAYKTPYSKDSKKELGTIIQWTTWAFVSNLQGQPIAKEDLAKKVHEQVGEVSSEKKEKLDEGIDDIWDAVQLTGIRAKLLPEKDEKTGKTGPSGHQFGGGIAMDAGKAAPKTEPKKESEEEIFKRLGWTQDEKGRWRPPTKPEKPKPPRWEEVVDPETGKTGLRLGPDGKPVNEGDPGYDKSKEEYEKQKAEDDQKRQQEELEKQKKAEKDAKVQEAKEKTKRDRENYDRRKQGDVTAWNEWVGQNPGRQKLQSSKPGKFNYFDESGKLVGPDIDG